MPSTARAFGYLSKVSFLSASVGPPVEIFCDVDILHVGELVACLTQAFPVDAVIIILVLIFVHLDEEFDVILQHDYVLDLCGVPGCYPLTIDDEHHSAFGVWSVKLLVVVAIDSVTGSLMLASFDHVGVHSNGLWVVFLLLVIILMGSKLFQIGGGPYFFAKLVTS